MKTTLTNFLPGNSRSFVRRVRPVLLALLLPLAAGAADPGAAEPKTHTLFMGADFSVEQGKGVYRVQDVVGASFLVRMDGQDRTVSAEHGTIKLKVDPTLKLTETSATVANLKCARSYTLRNDPTSSFLTGLAEAQLQFSDANYAQNQATDHLAWTMQKRAAIEDPSGQNIYEQAKAKEVAVARESLVAASSAPGGNSFRVRVNAGDPNAFDAIEVGFDVAAERPLASPYLVLIVRYRAPDAREGRVANWIYARALQPIGRESHAVRIVQGGFPPGFELLDYQVHLYNHGEEIATTVAPERVPLTRDEAHLYVVGEYVGSHKGATLPAVPAMGRLPADWPAQRSKQEFQQTYFVKVSKDGKASEVFADQACSRKVENPYLVGVVRNLRFKPALDKGAPVDGVAALRLDQLPI